MLKKLIVILFIFCFSMFLLGNVQAVDFDTPKAREAVARFDFGGANVRIGIRNTNATPFGERGSYDYREPEGQLLAHIEWLEEHFNCTIEFKDRIEDVEELVAATLTGDAGFDIKLIGATQFMPAALEGLLYPLDDVLEEDYFENYASYPRALNEMLGTTYRIGGATGGQAHVLFYNKELIEEAGLPDPYELWADNEWTWDAFEEIALETTMDLSGDGEYDQFGFASWWDNAWNQYLGFLISNEVAVTREEDGKIVFALDEPQALDGFDFLNGLYEEGALIFDMTNTEINEGRVAMWISSAIHVTMPDIPFSVVPFPEGPSSEGNTVWAGGAHGYGIPITTELDRRALIELIHAMHLNGRRGNPHDPGFNNPNSPYITQDIKQAWVDDIARNLHDRESLEVINWVYDHSKLVEGEMLVSSIMVRPFHNLVRDFIRGDEYPATYLASIKPEIQAIIDEMLD